MKKMSDFFELPVNHECLEIYGPVRAGIPYAEAEKRAAHAINHADALAEALDLLIQECGKVYSNSSALGDAELKAKIALANYRGEL